METETKEKDVSLDKNAKKDKKKEEKEQLLAKVPKVDENGISYTKIQLRRMMKRVKRGLDPVPTEQEERERIKQIRLEKREEEEELAGMLHTKDKDDDQTNNDGDEKEADDNEVEKGVSQIEERGVDSTSKSDLDVVDEFGRKREGKKEDQNPNQPMKKKRRAKPVPSDYVCFACKNKHSPLHWIYDCPDKIYKPGTNQVSKKIRGIADPSSCKVFVSGLPFEASPKDVEVYFDEKMNCGKVEQCKLFMFEDTKRCKGQGFVTFATEESAKKALKLNGILLELDCNTQKKKKNDKKPVVEKKKLTLGVKKVLNRRLTKKETSQ